MTSRYARRDRQRARLGARRVLVASSGVRTRRGGCVGLESEKNVDDLADLVEVGRAAVASEQVLVDAGAPVGPKHTVEVVARDRDQFAAGEFRWWGDGCGRA